MTTVGKPLTPNSRTKLKSFESSCWPCVLFAKSKIVSIFIVLLFLYKVCTIDLSILLSEIFWLKTKTASSLI